MILQLTADGVSVGGVFLSVLFHQVNAIGNYLVVVLNALPMCFHLIFLDSC